MAVLASKRHSALLELICLHKNVLFLLDRLSATGGQLNNILQLSMSSPDFIQNMLLNALFIAKSTDLVCDLLIGQDSDHKIRQVNFQFQQLNNNLLKCTAPNLSVHCFQSFVKGALKITV